MGIVKMLPYQTIVVRMLKKLMTMIHFVIVVKIA